MRPACARLLLLALLGVGLAGGCRRAPGAPPPFPEGVAARPIPDEVVAARLRLRAQDLDGLLSGLEADRPFDAARPERTWLLAQALASRGQGPAVRRRVAALPDGPFRAALEATLAEDAGAALGTLAPRLGRGADPWVLLAAGLVHASRGDTAPALSLARRAVGRGIAFVDVEALLLAGGLLREEGALEAAGNAAARAKAIEPTDIRAHAILADTARLRGDHGAAADALVEALILVPRSEATARRLADLLREHDGEGLETRVRAAWSAGADPANPEALALDGLLAERAGDVDRAAARYEAALAAGADPVPVDRDLRRLRVRAGRYAAAYALLLRAVPPRVRTDPLNLHRGRWEALEAAVAAAPTSAAPPEAREALARAFVGLGALDEAAAVLDGLATPGARDLARRLAGQRSLERALEALLERGYRRAAAQRAPTSLEGVLAALAARAPELLAPDEAAAFRTPTVGLRTAPFVGAWLDHATNTTSPVVRHFRRYGRQLVLGQRVDQPVEAVLLSIASITCGQPLETRGHRLTHDVVVGYDRTLRPFLDATGVGGLAGATLPDGMWLDADSARREQHALGRQLTRDPAVRRLAETGEALLAPGGWDGVLSLDEPSGVGIRLLLRQLEAARGDPWAAFEVLFAHERGHVVELKRHLPLGRNLPASLSLLASQGFSPTRLEAELERRAQLAAVAEGPYPDLALAQMVLPLPLHERTPEVHDGGYRDGLREIVRHVAAHPERYPEIDPTRRILPQLARLTPEEIRGAARAVLPR